MHFGCHPERSEGSQRCLCARLRFFALRAQNDKRGWERGGRSLYFRDPDQHLLELATPGTWPIY